MVRSLPAVSILNITVLSSRQCRCQLLLRLNHFAACRIVVGLHSIEKRSCEIQHGAVEYEVVVTLRVFTSLRVNQTTGFIVNSKACRSRFRQVESDGSTVHKRIGLILIQFETYAGEYGTFLAIEAQGDTQLLGETLS